MRTLDMGLAWPSSKCSSYILPVLFWCAAIGALGQATVKEKILSITTYPFSDPNRLPALAINKTVSRFYPYNVFDGYTDKGVAKDWKVITLKKRCITVSVLRERKVMGAIENATGR